MRVTILGANGKTGREVVKQALAAGHTVYGVVRREGGLRGSPNLHAVIGDATDTNVIVQASRGSDVIISALGTKSNKSTVITDAVKAVIAASKMTGCKRFILMSAFTVETERLTGPVKLMSGALKGMTDDKSTSENLLRNSPLDWTIVYPTRLTNQPKGSGLRVISETEKLGMKHTIARADVAAFMLGEAEKNAYLKKEVTISQ